MLIPRELSIFMRISRIVFVWKDVNIQENVSASIKLALSIRRKILVGTLWDRWIHSVNGILLVLSFLTIRILIHVMKLLLRRSILVKFSIFCICNQAMLLVQSPLEKWLWLLNCTRDILRINPIPPWFFRSLVKLHLFNF